MREYRTDEEERERRGFDILLRAHDYIWRAPYDLKLRMQVCQLLWELAIRVHEECIFANKENAHGNLR